MPLKRRADSPDIPPPAGRAGRHVSADDHSTDELEDAIMEIVARMVAVGEVPIDQRGESGTNRRSWRLVNDSLGLPAHGVRLDDLRDAFKARFPDVSIGCLKPVIHKHLLPLVRQQYGVAARQANRKIDKLLWYLPNAEACDEPTSGRFSRCLDVLLERGRLRLEIYRAPGVDPANECDSFVIRLEAAGASEAPTDGGNAQAAVETAPPAPIALDRWEEAILCELEKRAPRLMKRTDLEAKKECGTRKTVSEKLPRLVSLGLVCFPKNDAKGMTITDDGRRVVAELRRPATQ